MIDAQCNAVHTWPTHIDRMNSFINSTTAVEPGEEAFLTRNSTLFLICTGICRREHYERSLSAPCTELVRLSYPGFSWYWNRRPAGAVDSAAPLHVPRTTTSTYGPRSVAVSRPGCWILLPASFRNTSTISTWAENIAVPSGQPDKILSRCLL